MASSARVSASSSPRRGPVANPVAKSGKSGEARCSMRILPLAPDVAAEFWAVRDVRYLPADVRRQ